jgi:hypothetical protein
MGRLILLGLLVLLVVWLLRRALASPAKPAPPPAEQKGELVSCAHCSVNLPKSEAYAASGVLPGAGGRFYCSEEHWRLGPKES